MHNFYFMVVLTMYFSFSFCKKNFKRLLKKTEEMFLQMFLDYSYGNIIVML